MRLSESLMLCPDPSKTQNHIENIIFPCPNSLYYNPSEVIFINRDDSHEF